MFKVKTANYLLSAAWQSQWPAEDVPEICLAGRSNVGKSSFINTLVNQVGLARVSGTPGKTRTLNFYDINMELRFVDVPGYGYAKVNHKIKESFGAMIETYISERKTLKGMILILDYRHTPTQDDLMMYDYMKYHNFPVIVVATKEDKLKRNDLKKNEKKIKEKLNFHENDTFIRFSSLKKIGIDKAWDTIIKLCELELEEESE